MNVPSFVLRASGMAVLLALAVAMNAQTVADSTSKQPSNRFSIDANLMVRGEIRRGGLPMIGEKTEEEANFILSRTRIALEYERGGFTIHIAPQHVGVWGQKGKGSFNIDEAWARYKLKNGLFAQLGRQQVSYDDERILGRDDWAMVAQSHDNLRLGYEGHGHKLHIIAAFNQKSESASNGGTIYRSDDGSQPYKTMQAGWYHYDLPTAPLGASILFMNVGMQNSSETDPKTEYQQLIGAYVSYRPRTWSVEASYYHQLGTDEFHLPINAFMGSVKASYRPHPTVRLTGGYDYLSGDKNPVVPKLGQLGMARHDRVQGFSTVFGSHHKFYGAMDFFYASAFYGGYTPGLQNLFADIQYAPFRQLKFNASYHYFATATHVDDAPRTLGHELEFSANYQFLRDARISLGYSYMKGTQTLQRLQRQDKRDRLHWAWLMVVVSPRVFSTKW